MRLLDHLEVGDRWFHVAEHTLEAESVLVDSTSKWPTERVHKNATRLTNEQGWRQEEDIGPLGRDLFECLLQEKCPKEMLGDNALESHEPDHSNVGCPTGLPVPGSKSPDRRVLDPYRYEESISLGFTLSERFRVYSIRGNMKVLRRRKN